MPSSFNSFKLCDVNMFLHDNVTNINFGTEDLWPEEKLFSKLLAHLLMVVAVGVNLVAFLLNYFCHSRSYFHCICVANLSLVDLTLGVLSSLQWQLYAYSRRWSSPSFNCTTFTLAVSVIEAMQNISVASIALITLDRVCITHWPVRYHRRSQAALGAVGLVVSLWLASLVMHLSLYFLFHHGKGQYTYWYVARSHPINGTVFVENNYYSPPKLKYDKRHSIGLFYTSGNMTLLVLLEFLCPLILLIICNTCIYNKVSKRSHLFRGLPQGSVSKTSLPGDAASPTVGLIGKDGGSYNCSPLWKHRSSTHANLEDCSPSSPSNQVSQDFQRSTNYYSTLPNRISPAISTLPSRFSGRNVPERKLPQSPTTSSKPALLRNCSVDSDAGEIHLRRIQRRRISLQNFIRSPTNPLSATFPYFSRLSSVQSCRESQEYFLYQVIRRQYRRTLKILLVLVGVFIICRLPRVILLTTLYLTSSQFQSSTNYCFSTEGLDRGLFYTNMLVHMNPILDPVIYSFWGNRRYKGRLQKLWKDIRSWSGRIHR